MIVKTSNMLFFSVVKTIVKKAIQASIFSISLSLTSFAQAEELPLWTLDLGLGVFSIDSYAGADYNKILPVPLPDFQLNSPYLQSSRGGIKARILDSDKIDLGLSVGGSIPTKSKHIDARSDRDMPDLDPTIEIGLALQFKALETDNWDLLVKVPVRKATALAVEDQDELYRIQKPVDIGWSYTPRVKLVRHFGGRKIRNSLGVEVGSRYATQQNNKFFYSLDSAFATLEGDTPFEASGGLVNHWVEISYERRWENWRLSTWVEHKDMHDAENVLSPLVEVKDTLVGGIIVSYSFAKSDVMVDLDDDL